jgi:hypothetical protein
VLERLARDKRSSLSVVSDSDRSEKFYATDGRKLRCLK